MKILTSIFCGLALAFYTAAQTGESSRKDEARAAARANADPVPLPSIKSLTSAQAAGKKLFVQRCSVCHLPALPSYTAYGPVLDGAVVADRGEEAVRLQIMHGSPRMPGFQYTLSTAEIDQIVSYLKNLELFKKD
jgi:mono/diheme cytochrome c family protein